ncbi:MAG: hypothetical protein ACI8XB_001458 [Patiriisocius sp.]|jgi:hypothetical protein
MKNYYLKLTLMSCCLLASLNSFSQIVGINCDSALPISEGIYFTPELIDGNGAVNNCFANAGDGTNAAWYNYTPSQSGLVTIASQNDPNQTDTRLSVYIGACDDLFCIGSDDDSGEVFTSFLQVEVGEGIPVFIEWDDRWDAGAFEFQVTFEDDEFDCPDLNTNIGDSCDDGNPNTTSDSVNPNCICQGTITGDTPFNDNCSGATVSVVPSNGNPIWSTGDATGATQQLPGANSPEVWESFTISECSDVILSLCGTDAAVNAFYFGFFDCDNLDVNPTLIGTFVDVNCPDQPFGYSWNALPAGTYVFAILAGDYGLNGPYTIQWTAVASSECNPDVTENAICEDAIAISEGIVSDANISGGNGASNNCFGSGAVNAIWYEYTASQTGLVTVSSSIDLDLPDTRVSIYSGTCDDLSCVVSDDDGGEGFTSFLTFETTAGESYFIEWDDRWDDGSFSFIVEYEPLVISGCTDPEAINYNEEANLDDGSCVYEFDCVDNTVILEFTDGSFLGEIFWSVSDAEGEFYAEGLYYSNQNSAQHYLCLPDGCYSLNMYDSFGDGWNGAIATISIDGNTVAEGTLEEGSVGNLTFGVNEDECEDIVLEIFGCTDTEASNYNSSATIDDGSCIYPFSCEDGIAAQLYVCVFGNGQDIDFNVSGNDGIVVFDQTGFQNQEILYMDVCLLEDVCYTATMSNTAGPFGWYGGYYWINVGGTTVSTGSLDQGLETDALIFSIDGTCGEVYGCTDPEAENYNPDATIDNGTCTYQIANDNCSDAQTLSEGTITINNAGATSEGLYGECWGFGNGEPEQNGIWYSFTTPDEPALIVIEASADNSFSFTDTQFGLYNECGGEMIDCDGNGGDGLYSRFDFECGSLEPSTEYLLLIDGWAGNQGTCLLTYSVALVCDAIEGCTDPQALNYNPEATLDDGSCVYTSNCTENEIIVEFELGQWQGEVSWFISDAYGDAFIYAEGNTNGGEPLAICLPDGCFTLVMFDTFGDGWNGNIITLSGPMGIILETTMEEGGYGTEIFSINADCWNDFFGCTDPNALNYDPEATIDDGSCVYDNWCDSNSGFMFLYNEPNSFGLWDLTNDQGEYFYGGSFSDFENTSFEICLPDGCYQFCVYGDFAPVDGFAEFFIGDEGHFFEFTDQGCYALSVNANCSGENILGCTDPEALNYNPTANIDDGSCFYENECDSNSGYLSIFTDGGATGAWGIVDENGQEQYFGIFDDTGEVGVELCLSDGCYQLCFIGEFEPASGSAYVEIAGNAIGIEFVTQGCFEFGVNYDCQGNGIIFGCTDPEALNYNPFANIDDGSCIFFSGECQASFEIISVDEDEDVVYILNTSTIDWGIEYLWDFGDGSTSTAPLPIHTYAEDGLYTICLTITGPDCEDTFCMEVFYDSSGFTGSGDGQGANNSGFTINVIDNDINGVEEFNDDFYGLNVYPNPAIEEINLQYDLKESADVSIKVYSLTGQLLVDYRKDQNSGSNLVTLPVLNLSSGMYILEVSANNSIKQERFNVLK